MSLERPLSKRGSILLGLVVAALGIGIVLLSFFASPEKFQAPRWVVACVGGAFLFFGGWITALYGLGYDPKRPETLPSPAVQLAVFVPGMLLFAAPFHWVAFGPGPRQFSTTVSIPFLAVQKTGGSAVGRIAFGIGALLIDAMIVGSVIRLVRQMHRPASQSTPTAGNQVSRES